MTLIGMLHTRNHPKSIRKAYACAAVAKLEGHEFFYFSPSKVNLNTKSILGWVYEKGEWVTRMMPFPDVIYNAVGPKTEEQWLVYRSLKQMIPFTSYSVGTKMTVYNKIRNGKDFADFLIPYKQVKTFSTILKFLSEHKKIVMKPYSGSQGRNVYFLEKVGDNYILYNGDKEVVVDKQELSLFYEENIKTKKFLVQKYIFCKTKSGFPYDFRIHMQKGAKGEWHINRIYPRLTGGNKPINNISSGGFRGEIDTFLINEFGVESENIKKYLEHFALRFTPHFESLYNKKFDEFGLDLGIDENRKLWIFEVNWRPGSKSRELDFARYQILYAAYVAENCKNG